MEITALTPAAGSAAANVDSATGPQDAGRAEAEQWQRVQAAAQDAAAANAAPADEGGWKQLETMLVQQMLQSMLSSEEGGFFGKELGSDYYASFMAEQFAARLSDGLDLGIASRLDRHYGPGDDR